MKPEDHSVEVNEMIKEQFEKEKCSKCPNVCSDKKTCKSNRKNSLQCYLKYLEEKLKQAESCIDLDMDDYNKLLAVRDELKKENEQLKEFHKKTKNIIQRKGDMIDKILDMKSVLEKFK